MLTSASPRAHCFLALLFAFAIACIGAAPGTAWADDTELVTGSFASENNGIPVLTLTIDPDEFQKVINSPRP